MANITITERGGSIAMMRAKKVFWFVALWVTGVGGAMLLALPFKLLIKAGAALH
ncbi:hypothetical protein P9250_12930 [Caballeronia sp. LP006]|jgi:hypothetical protein|uniref:hypothetical protein n=1 Tax=unclassified Caballeronia TaxID=2646786 RepID=UPI002028F159|nr:MULTISPECIES: hypothetical protein [unclassified Caballeronia]MDR5775428.1 hypothetical protein [Caballeronia sp. LZ002]MDR5801743.1 hypothetical protein [Caballeronia sp. LZ001]MDR5828786.1 hypothetical protein [Caballeronia sp. LP006]MDR5850866.1 hypothetical protein [Caballeronia sp. LZ003]